MTFNLNVFGFHFAFLQIDDVVACNIIYGDIGFLQFNIYLIIMRNFIAGALVACGIGGNNFSG